METGKQAALLKTEGGRIGNFRKEIADYLPEK
jgi:hypothetical protein